MYKKQMKFEKVSCFLALIAGVLVFIYSLGLVTDLYDSLYQMMPEPSDPTYDYVKGVRIFYDIQDFNKALTSAGIVMILLGVFLLVMNTHTRRRYYIGNYVAIGAFSVASCYYTGWALAQLAKYKKQFLTEVDFEELKVWAEMWKSPYSKSTFWFDMGTVVFGILMVTAVLLIINLVWKIKVTKEEQALISQGKGAAIHG